MVLDNFFENLFKGKNDSEPTLTSEIIDDSTSDVKQRTLKETRKTPSELILERYNEILRADGMPAVNELPSATSDEYKLQLLNSKRLSLGMDTLGELPSSLKREPEEEPEEEPTDDEKRLGNLRASRRGEPPLYPEIEGLEITDEDPDIDEGEENLERLGRTKDPNLFGDFDNQGLKDYREDLTNQLRDNPDNQDIKDEINAVAQEQRNRGQDLQNDLNQRRPDREPEPDPELNNDLESTQDHHEKTDETTIQDDTLDFSHLGGTRTNFDTNFIRFILNEFVKKSVNHLTSSATGIDADVVNIVTEPVVNAMPNLYEMLTGGGLNDYTRMNIDGKHQIFKTPTIPLLCITIYLYMVDKSSDFKVSINMIDSVIIKYTLTRIFNMSDSDIEYALSIFKMIPDELRTAYNKQTGSMAGELSLNEEQAIARFIDKINIDYRTKFQTSLKDDLFKYENKQSLYLYEMIETLNTSPTLFEFSSAFNTMNEMIKEMIENPYIIVQLMALIYDAAEDKSILGIDSKFMSNKKIYYYDNNPGKIVKFNEVSILKDMEAPLDQRGSVGELIENSDKVALYKYNNRYYVTFRGTDIKSEEDIRQNFLNFGGKDILYNIEYNQRIIQGKKYLDFAIKKSQQEGIQPPSVVGYSLGGISSMYLSTLYPNIETNVYAPLLSRSKLTENIMDHLQNNNIHFNYVDNDPISKNLKYYKNKYRGLDIKKYKNNKKDSSHSLNQFF